MAHESSHPARLVVLGALCGLGAGVLAVGLTFLLTAPLTDGLRDVGLIFLDAHFAPGLETVADLPPLTWFDVPATALYLLPPAAIVTGGIVAARLTRTTRARIGVLAGLALVLGYAPPVIAVAVSVGADLVMTTALAVVYALVWGAVGGLVGART